MKYLVCFSPKFVDELEALRDRQLQNQVEELKNKLEELDVFFAGQWLGSIRPYRKHRFRNYRVIMKEFRYGNQKVLVFLRVFRRADRDYVEFLDSKSLPEPDNLQALVAERVALAKKTNDQPADIPSGLRGWLGPLTEVRVGAEQTEFFVHEARRWVSQVGRVFIEEGRGTQLLYQVVLNLVLELEDNPEQAAPQTRVVRHQELANCHVIWGLRDARTLCLLDASVDRPTEQDFEAARIVLNSETYEAGIKKAYLSASLLDEDLWRDIQKSEDGNLFLSPDEISLLERLANPARVNESDAGTRRTHALPALISGRAGTGKSTMLAYVFASLVLRQARQNLDGRPVYVTYNPRLLDKARQTVRGLLRSNADFRSSTSTETKARLQEVMRNLDTTYVLSYHDLLRSYLDEEEQDTFGDAQRIDFSDFKAAYMGESTLLPMFRDHAFRREVSPERAWYIIRQFIKGSSVDAELATETEQDIVDQHGELNEADRLGVSAEEVGTVYRRVYAAWYRDALVSKSLWDDQDLVKSALEGLFKNRPNRPKITAVICDEAQDFTPREIRFLVRCCELLRYDLQNIEPLAVPIVLAGDSLQTLAPTGFRWSAVRAILFEEIWAACGKDCYPESLILRQNYRSRDAIVKFCNLIQMTRRELFPNREDSREIEPQMAWDPSPSPWPSYYRVGWNLSLESFKNVARRMIVLLPCEEAGELDFIRQDQTLSTLLGDRQQDDVLETVMSSSAAKGQEWPEVILYNFGRQFTDSGFSLNPQNDPDNYDFASEFFFNKLYVAASRACQSLYIVENDHDGSVPLAEIPRLLQPMVVEDDAVASAMNGNGAFDGQVVRARFGEERDLNEAESAITPENGKKFLESGITLKDKSSLKRAAQIFNRLGPEYLVSERLALAWAYRVGGENDEAIRFFQLADAQSEAWETALEASLWDAASTIQVSFPEAARHEVELVTMMRSQRDDIQVVLSLLSALGAAMRSKVFRISKLWLGVQEEIKARVLTYLGSEVVPSEISENVVSVTDLRSALKDVAYGANGLNLLRAEIGDCYVVEKDWREALDAYGATTRLSDLQKKRRVYATAHIQGFPRGLAVLSEEKMTTEILKLWEASGSPYESDWYSAVGPALIAKPDHTTRFEFASKVKNVDHAFSSLMAMRPDSAKLLHNSFVELAVARFDKYELITSLVREVRMSDPRAANQLIEVAVIGAVSRWERPDDFGLSFQAFQLDSHRDAVPLEAKNEMVKLLDMYDPNLGEKSLDPRWHGRAMEFANDWQRAIKHYDGYTRVGGVNKEIKQFCRAGYLRSLNRWGRGAGAMSERQRSFGGGSDQQDREAEVAEKLEVGRKWKLVGSGRGDTVRYDNEKCRDGLFPLVAVPPLREVGGEEYQENGKFADFKWDTDDRVIFLSHRPSKRQVGRVGATTWTIDPSSTGSVMKADVVVDKSPDGLVRFEVDRWRVEVRFTKGETVVAIDLLASDGADDVGDDDGEENHYKFKVKA